MSLCPPAHYFWYTQVLEMRFQLSEARIKNNAHYSLILEESMEEKTPYSTLKMNSHLLSDEKSQSLHTSRWREPSELCVL